MPKQVDCSQNITVDNLADRSLKNEEWMDSQEAANYLRISIGSLRNMTSNGQIPHFKLGRRNRYLRDELRELLLSEQRGKIRGN
ncbi:MAG: DNA-binding protein [Proteobacteria bacterium]|nr:MAG: DNA-binding protein [Pseudomonadota bacterium]